MFLTSNDQLEVRIKQLKKDLIRIVEATGLNSHETLNCSQKLDKLITDYQKNSSKAEHNKREKVNV
ncbi:aspartyl-phosphate phosphatase Spo0E family protein [Peribacillus glennii]|uniref:Aspartyl-phosphate phosphatase Spo0E family protein n=1 Tax=Peribacillus glennii TaxID=2303991 RepID=A0A372LGI6_9BACI|nr:aspartyl-phosphate phosphatase Spo0E family protein [Peribacillus glennii]RFU64716.1 aspartyl-phosphate phosphatase Spo0E family protein [Peribacillus glennii]